MITLAYLIIAYLCIGVLLATVIGGAFLINEYKQNKLRNLYMKEFVFMLITLVLMWPLLFIELLGD